MKNIILCLSSFLLLSCSDNNNPVNNNSASNDVLLFSKDTFALEGYDTCYNQYTYTITDNTLRKVKISFRGLTDFDSTALSVIVQYQNSVYLNYLKVGINQINCDHTISCSVSGAHTYYFDIGIISTSSQILHFIKLIGIKVYKVNG